MIKMKNIFLLIVTVIFLFVLSCKDKKNEVSNRFNTFIDTNKNDYTATWDANNEPNISHYNLYVWSGLDSAQSPFDSSRSTGFYRPYFVKRVKDTTTKFIAIADGKSYIQIALSAVDSSGNRSKIGVSNIIKAIEVADSVAYKE